MKGINKITRFKARDLWQYLERNVTNSGIDKYILEKNIVHFHHIKSLDKICDDLVIIGNII